MSVIAGFDFEAYTLVRGKILTAPRLLSGLVRHTHVFNASSHGLSLAEEAVRTYGGKSQLSELERDESTDFIQNKSHRPSLVSVMSSSSSQLVCQSMPDYSNQEMTVLFLHAGVVFV